MKKFTWILENMHVQYPEPIIIWRDTMLDFSLFVPRSAYCFKRQSAECRRRRSDACVRLCNCRFWLAI